MNNNQPIQLHAANTLGKDYVIGDLHGCFGLLQRLMAEVNFNYANDRVFSVGDIIDRGPESFRCLELLAEPWFFAVQGNHELMMQEFFWPYIQMGKIASLDELNNNGFLDYGGAWVETFFDPTQHAMHNTFTQGLNQLADLPQMMIIGSGASRFHVTPCFRLVVVSNF
jgi:serine/threonine protein phosphatase 1